VTTGEITEDVRQFVAEHVDSLEQLEVLLLLQRHAVRAWSADDVSRELRSSYESSGRRLAALAAGGLLQESDGAYRYAPRSSELDAAARALERAYVVRRLAVTELIFSRPLAQVRAFADAFKMRERS
jgi:hypothetical protein